MSDDTFLIVALSVAAAVAIVLRLTLLKSGSAFRQWMDARIQPVLKKGLQVFFVLTLFVWIIAWGTADKDQRGALSISFREFLDSMKIELPGREQADPAPGGDTIQPDSASTTQ